MTQTLQREHWNVASGEWSLGTNLMTKLQKTLAVPGTKWSKLGTKKLNLIGHVSQTSSYACPLEPCESVNAGVDFMVKNSYVCSNMNNVAYWS